MWNNVRLLRTLSNFFLLVFVIVAGAEVCAWLFKRSDHAVRIVTVQSADGGPLEHVNDVAVKNMAIPEIKGNFFTVDLEEVRKAFETVPWVRSASVRREWPDKIVVTLEEHKAVGPWGDGGDRVLSSDGEIFTVDPEEVSGKFGQLQFYGPDGSGKEVLAHYQTFRQKLAVVGLEPTTVKLSDRYAWSVTMDTGLTVEFGRADDEQALNALIDRFISIYPRITAKYGQNIGYIDMRYRNGFALRLSRSASDSADKSKEEPAEDVQEAEQTEQKKQQ